MMNKIIQGDCLREMTKLDIDSIDLVVTDPPYGYNFMGKDWDKAVPSIDIWKQCLRVLKPGAFAFIMSSPRADVLSQMIVRISEAGFRTDFSPIYWAYASGFPKAMNISKAVDKRLGLKREVIATIKKTHISNENTNEGWKRPSHEGKTTMDITISNSQEAKLLDGSYGGFQPKPAVEVIIVAMKPLSEKTFVEQALDNGKGVTWLDNCRLPFQSEVDKAESLNNWKPESNYDVDKTVYELGMQKLNTQQNNEGRFPANLLVSDDCLNDGSISKSTVHTHKHNPHNELETDIFGNGKGLYEKGIEVESQYNDEGSFSRYFSLDSWFEKQFKKLPQEVQRTFPFLIEPKASKSERDKNLDALPERAWVQWQTANGTSDKPSSISEGRNTKRRNIHPTVKPLQLMSYLITLGCRSNDLVLDPFCGSGTTCLAAKMLGRNSIGIELNPEYVKIAEARVNKHNTLFDHYSPVSNKR